MEINIRKDKMTKDERWLEMFNRQPLDRIPVHGFSQSFFTVHCGLTIADAYNNAEVVNLGDNVQDIVDRNSVHDIVDTRL